MQICLWKQLMHRLITAFNLLYEEGYWHLDKFCLGQAENDGLDAQE